MSEECPWLVEVLKYESLLDSARKHVMPGESDSYESVWVMVREMRKEIEVLRAVLKQVDEHLKSCEGKVSSPMSWIPVVQTMGAWLRLDVNSALYPNKEEKKNGS